MENPGLATQGGSKKEKNSNTTDRKLFAWEMYLGLLLRTREVISVEEGIVIKKVMVPQGMRGGGKGRFEALWDSSGRAVPMSCSPLTARVWGLKSGLSLHVANGN